MFAAALDERSAAALRPRNGCGSQRIGFLDAP